MTKLLAVLALLPVLAVPAFARTYDELPSATAGEHILIIAPHIDDEALAAAGYTHDAIADGAKVYIVYLTAGDHSRTALAINRLTFFATAKMNRKGERRIGEAESAASRLGLPASNLIFLGYPDRGLRSMLSHPERTIRSASTGSRSVPYGEALSPGAPYRLGSLLSDLEHVIDFVQPDIVIAPVPQDHHPDHRTAARMIEIALAHENSHALRLGYLIHAWTYADHFLANQKWLRPPARMRNDDWLVYPLSGETAERKHDVLLAFRSQRRSPYLRLIFSSFSGHNEIFLREGS